MNVIDYLQDRSFIYQTTNDTEIKKKFLEKKYAVYAGFDPTAKSLHIGNLMSVMLLRTFQKFGFKVIALIGGATAKIGDPSGRDKVRDILSAEKIESNKQNITKILSKFLNIEGENKVEFVDNNDWLADYNYIEFLRKIGSNFSVNQMLRYESVKQRLDREQNLSFLEFNYMILQAYDFVHLKKNYNCILQVGGSDQWGNIVNGIELNRKINFEEKEEIYGLTTKLLVDSNNKKMGKTVDGAIWLDEKLLSPYDYFQFFRNVTDDKVIESLNYFTELEKTEIAKLAKLTGQEINQAKKILAYEATKICHGEKKAKEVLESSNKVFEENKLDDNLPKINLKKDDFVSGIEFSALIAKTNIVASRGEAKRIILGGGGRINDKVEKQPLYLVTEKDFLEKDQLKISAGKKKHAIIKII